MAPRLPAPYAISPRLKPLPPTDSASRGGFARRGVGRSRGRRNGQKSSSSRDFISSARSMPALSRSQSLQASILCRMASGNLGSMLNTERLGMIRKSITSAITEMNVLRRGTILESHFHLIESVVFRSTHHCKPGTPASRSSGAITSYMKDGGSTNATGPITTNAVQHRPARRLPTSKR
jgi:hypothetical protein